MGWFGKKKPETVTHTQTFELRNPPREVRMDVVEEIDRTLARVGRTEVMHAIDAGRIVSFRDGGPPVWSVALTEVAAHVPYTLLVTYGFSGVLSPEPERQGLNYELSLAVGHESPVHPWAVALLRHLCRYQLTSGNELMVGDVMPCHAPITCIPFPPEHHAAMPPTNADSLVVVNDPVLGTIATPHGVIAVRRIVGITAHELRVIGPEPAAHRESIYGETNPDFITFL